MPKIETCGMAVVMYEGKVLTISEMVFGRQVLSLPKGHREDGEDIIDTAIRECFEETNIRLDRSQLICELTPYSYEFTSSDNAFIRKTVHPFLFKAQEEGRPKATEKRMVSVDWMDTDEFITKCTYDSVKSVIAETMTRL